MQKNREYTAEYKTKLILEALREEKSVSEIAQREGINTNMLRNWRHEFTEKASMIFSKNKKENELTEKVKELKEKEREYQAKVGQLTLEIDWLKKKSEEVFGEGWESQVNRKR